MTPRRQRLNSALGQGGFDLPAAGGLTVFASEPAQPAEEDPRELHKHDIPAATSSGRRTGERPAYLITHV
jgi:hypothetical protein